MKTIRQIASEIGVSKQTVEKKISLGQPLRTSLEPHMLRAIRNTYYIDEAGENLIKLTFGMENIKNIQTPQEFFANVYRLIAKLESQEIDEDTKMLCKSLQAQIEGKSERKIN